MTAGRCEATTKDGRPCSAQALPGRAVCIWHDQSPEGVARRREVSSRGGRGRSGLSRLRRGLPTGDFGLPEVRGLLGLVLRDLLAGKIDPSVANAAANVGRAYVAVNEASDLEARLAALEALAEPGRRSG